MTLPNRYRVSDPRRAPARTSEVCLSTENPTARPSSPAFDPLLPTQTISVCHPQGAQGRLRPHSAISGHTQTHTNAIAPASAANTSGFIQTALSKVTRRITISPVPRTISRRVTPDRDLSYKGAIRLETYAYPEAGEGGAVTTFFFSTPKTSTISVSASIAVSLFRVRLLPQ